MNWSECFWVRKINLEKRRPLTKERKSNTDTHLNDEVLKCFLPYSDGTSHLLFTPEEFIEKLSAIIPPPKSHLVKWSGVFAPNSPCRKKVVLKPDEKKGKSPKSSCTEDIPLKNSSWSKMLAKVFKIDVTKCQHCKGDMAILAAITNHSEVARYLKHLGIEHEAPARAPPRYQEESFEFGSVEELDESITT